MKILKNIFTAISTVWAMGWGYIILTQGLYTLFHFIVTAILLIPLYFTIKKYKNKSNTKKVTEDKKPIEIESFVKSRKQILLLTLPVFLYNAVMILFYFLYPLESTGEHDVEFITVFFFHYISYPIYLIYLINSKTFNPNIITENPYKFFFKALAASILISLFFSIGHTTGLGIGKSIAEMESFSDMIAGVVMSILVSPLAVLIYVGIALVIHFFVNLGFFIIIASFYKTLFFNYNGKLKTLKKIGSIFIILLAYIGIIFSIYINYEGQKEYNEKIESGSFAEERLASIDKSRPIWGHRYKISGDFNGDGKTEISTERFFSSGEYKEAAKYLDGVEYDDLVAINAKKDSYTVISSDDKRIPDYRAIRPIPNLGFLYLKNEGDLNDDGIDEIGFVVDNADFSNLNQYHVITYKNNKWVELLSFKILEQDLPEMPETSVRVNLNENLGTETSYDFENDNESKRIIKDEALRQQREFVGFIKKIGKRKVEIETYDNESNKVKKFIKIKKI